VPESYVITHHVITHYYVASDYMQTAVCHIGLLIGLHTVSKLSYATHATQRMHGLQSKRNTQLAQDATDSVIESIAFFVSVHCGRCSFFYLCRMTSMCCVRCVQQIGTDL